MCKREKKQICQSNKEKYEKLLLFIVIIFSAGSVLCAQETVKKKQQFQWNKATMDSLNISTDVQTKINDVKKNKGR
jgi:hypothetical protein